MTFLKPEPPVDSDAQFRNFMRHNLAQAAGQFGLDVAGPPVFGWRLRTIGACCRGKPPFPGKVWLRVVSEEVSWDHGRAWTGPLEANRISGIAKPRVLATEEWVESDWRVQRAEVLTLVAGSSCARTPAPAEPIALPDRWWVELRNSLRTLSTVRTERVFTDQDKLRSAIENRFGSGLPTAVARWETVHGDLHWANLMGPEFAMIDWELWGVGPAGLDAANLRCYSLLSPQLRQRVDETFAAELSDGSVRATQLFAIARLLRRVDQGEFPELARPLQRYADMVMDSDRTGLRRPIGR